MTPALRYNYRHFGMSDQMRCFQVLGFDIMLSRDFHAYLLEVNNSPSISVDEALPLEESSPCETDRVCRCMDMAQPHRHQTSLVDLEVKSTVIRDTFQSLAGLNIDGDADSESFMRIPVDNDGLLPLLAQVEALYHQAGGASIKLSPALQPLEL